VGSLFLLPIYPIIKASLSRLLPPLRQPVTANKYKERVMKIRSYSFEEFIERVNAFHGYAAPGVILGGVMVDLAYQNLPEKGLFDAVCETRRCLPDSVQLLTPCTIGNGWLRIIDMGRYALVFYDKETGKGIRVYIDAAKIEGWDQLKYWYFKLKPKKETDAGLILKQIQEAGASIMGVQKVNIDLGLFKKESRRFAICPVCKEAYPDSDGDKCLYCQGKLEYYTVQRS
jgi:formylmethanofuran dehydrogenase subunit E